MIYWLTHLTADVCNMRPRPMKTLKLPSVSFNILGGQTAFDVHSKQDKPARVTNTNSQNPAELRAFFFLKH